MKRFLNAVLFQVVWFVCLLAGSVWALVATFIYLWIHDRYFMRTRKEWRLLFTFAMLGFVIDSTLFQLGVFSNQDSSGVNLAPLWLICLWASTATLFAHSLSVFRARYRLLVIIGAIGPVFSYYAGAKMAGIRLAEPAFFSLALIAAIWAMVLPIGFYLSEKWALFNASDHSIKGH